MHELSIAESIVAVAERHARGRRVARVEVKIGYLRQVVPSALEFSFDLVAAGTVVDGAELQIENMPVRIACRTCAVANLITEFPFACPACGGVDVDIESGDELLVDALELVEEPILLGRSG